MKKGCHNKKIQSVDNKMKTNSFIFTNDCSFMKYKQYKEVKQKQGMKMHNHLFFNYNSRYKSPIELYTQ